MPFPFVAIAVSLAVSAATSAAAAALTPTQKIDKGGLNDLAVSKSSYGETIPQCWGQIELAGNLLWATKIKEVTETEQQGGSGGGAEVTERSYFANFAVAFAYTPHRSAEQFVRLKLNGKTVYDPTNPDPQVQQASTEFASEYCRFYYGTFDQPVDPLMANTTPVQSYDYGLPHDPQAREAALSALGLPSNLNHIPAYRYKVYIVFENLPLKDYSNSIPAVKAEILFNSNNTAGTIVTDICTQVGITDIDTESISNISIPGFYLDRQVPATEALRFLQRAYFFDIIKSGHTLKFVSQSQSRTAIAIPIADLGATEGANATAPFSLPKPDPYNLPESVEINFLDRENSYDNGNVIARSQVAGSKRKESYSFPIVMTSAQATALADTLLHKFYLEAITPEFDLPPKYAYLEVGDWVTVNLYGETGLTSPGGNLQGQPLSLTLQITKIWMGANRLLKINTKLVDAANLSNFNTTVTIPTGGYNPPVAYPPAIPGTTNLYLLDAHLIRDNDADNGIYATAYGTGNWTGCSIYSSVDNSAYYFTQQTVDAPGTIGTLTSNFNSSSTTVTVTLLNGSLETVSTAQLDAGINKLLVGNEIIQFETAISNGNQYQLTGLRRGKRGTESYQDAHTIGETVVLLTGSTASVIRIPGNQTDLGQLRYFKAPANGQSLNSATPVSLTILGLSLKPYSPVNLTATKDLGENITIEWQRRDRKAGDAITYDNLPLSEASERYEIEILNNNTVVRTIESYEPRIVYLTPSQITDFGVSPSSITVRIYQISAAVGRGYPTTATLAPTLVITPPVITKIVPSTITIPSDLDIYGNGLSQVIGVSRGQDFFGTNFQVINDGHLQCSFLDVNTASGFLEIYTATQPSVGNTPDIVSDAYLTIIAIDLSDYALKTDLDAYAKLSDLDPYAKLSDLDAYMKKVDYLLANTLINPAKISYPIGTGKTVPYTLTIADLGLELAFNNATGNLIIPNGISGSFPTGWGCVVSLTGTGTITIQRSDNSLTGLVFGGGNSNNKLKTQGAIAITHKGSNIWLIVGRLEQ